MKRYSCVAIFIMIFFIFIGCSRHQKMELEGNSEVESVSSDYEITATEEDVNLLLSSEINMEELEITETDIYRLVDENYYCITNIYAYSYLEFEYDEWINEAPIEVSDDRFKSFQELEDYLRNVYIKEEADYLLYEYWQGEPLYFEQDGIFMMKMVANGGGMLGAWQEYTVEEICVEGNTCQFVIQVKYSEGIEQIDKYVFYATYEEKWLLNEMVSKPLQ